MNQIAETVVTTLADVQERMYTAFVFDVTQPSGQYPVTYSTLLVSHQGITYYSVCRAVLDWQADRPGQSDYNRPEIVDVIEDYGPIPDGVCLDIARRYGTAEYPAFGWELLQRETA